jgi:hypothetical protein
VKTYCAKRKRGTDSTERLGFLEKYSRRKLRKILPSKSQSVWQSFVIRY